MSYNGENDCPEQECLTGLDLPNHLCTDAIDAAWIAKLNKKFDDLAAALCCVAGGVPEVTPIDSVTYNTQKGETGQIPITAFVNITIPLTVLRINTNPVLFIKVGNAIRATSPGKYIIIAGATSNLTSNTILNETFDVDVRINGALAYFHQWGNMQANDDSDANNAFHHVNLNANDLVTGSFYTERNGGFLSGALTLIKLSD